MSLVLLASCDLFNKEQNPEPEVEPSVSQKRFEHFEKDFVAIKDFIEAHRDKLYIEEPTAVYYGYDKEGFYLFTNDSLDTLRIDSSLQKNFENIYILINANGGYDYINCYKDKISFEFSGGTSNITYNKNDEAPTFDKPSAVKWRNHKYTSNWYYMLWTEVNK